jgi:hypothetical protein
MKSLYDYLGCGKFEKTTVGGGALNFNVYKLSDVREKRGKGGSPPTF